MQRRIRLASSPLSSTRWRAAGRAHLAGRNIVATAFLGSKLDLKAIAMNAKNAEYNPRVRCHSGRPPQSAVLTLFAWTALRGSYHAHSRAKDNCVGVFLGQNGHHRRQGTAPSAQAAHRMHVCLTNWLAGKSEEDAKLASRKYARIIEKLKLKDVAIKHSVRSPAARLRRCRCFDHPWTGLQDSKPCCVSRCAVPGSPGRARVRARRLLERAWRRSRPNASLTVSSARSTNPSCSPASSIEWSSRRSCCSFSSAARSFSRVPRSETGCAAQGGELDILPDAVG
jgi:hypothetical protein